jgi:hypothetical protein
MSKISNRIAKKQNALKHGVYSREVMLPGEKWSDYEALRNAHYDEFMPDGVMEECLVDELFKLRWRKRRMDQYDQIRLRQRAAHLQENNDMSRHRMNLKTFAAEFSNATSVEAVEQILYLLSPLYISVIASRVPCEKFEDPTEWGPAIGKFLLDFTLEEPLEDEALFAEIVDPDLMEKEISRSIRLEEAIDRKIKRIIQVKAAKQIFPNMRKNATSEPKLISAGVNANAQPPAITESERTPATQIEPAMQIEMAGTVEPDAHNGAFTPQNGVVIVDISEGGYALITPDVSEKEHSAVEHGMVEVFAKPKWVPRAT